MRILLLTHHYAPETGPPQLRWSGLAQEFADAGHHLDVIAPHPHYPIGRLLDDYESTSTVDDPELGEHGESIYRVRFRGTHGSLRSVMLDQLVVAVATLIMVLRLRRRLAADVIVATAPALPTLIVGLLAKLVLRRPVVMEVRDAWPDLIAVSDHWEGRQQRLSWQKRLGLALAPAVITWLQRRADHVITTSDSFARVLRDRRVRRVTTVRNAPHPIENYPVHVPRAQPDSLRVVYVGTVGRAQGLVTAVEALRIARAQGLDVQMRVIGTGVGKKDIAALADAEGLPIIVRGAQPRNEIHHHYEWGDTFLVMLRDWEALQWTVPSKLYEAMSIGMHVSGSVAGEAAGIIEETECGFAVSPEDPDELAAQWIALSQTRSLQVDRARSTAWLKEHASEELAAQTYLEVLTHLAVVGAPAPATRASSHSDLRALTHR